MHRTLAQVAGENARSIRINAGLTLDEVAAVAKLHGLPWTTGRVGDFESGRVSPSLPTVFAYALALADATGTKVTLANLFAGGGEVAINDALAVPLTDFRMMLAGNEIATRPTSVSHVEAVKTRGDDGSVTIQLAESAGYAIVPQWLMREADYRIAKELGIPPEKAQAAMLALWGKPFTAERDQRAGVDANAQRKGQISRQLKTEIQQYLKPGRKRRGNSK